MTYKELYIQLEKELINPIRSQYKGLYNHDAYTNMKMLIVSEVFKSLDLYESINNTILSWDDIIVDGLELACKNDIIMFISELEEIKECE